MLFRMIGNAAVQPLISFSAYPVWLKESVVIIAALGALEIVLWMLDRQELKEQTSLLEEILVTLLVKEYGDGKIADVQIADVGTELLRTADRR